MVSKKYPQVAGHRAVLMARASSWSRPSVWIISFNVSSEIPSNSQNHSRSPLLHQSRSLSAPPSASVSPGLKTWVYDTSASSLPVKAEADSPVLLVGVPTGRKLNPEFPE